MCDWSGEVVWEWAFLKFHSHTTTPYPPLPLHDFHSISRAPLHPLPTLTPHSGLGIAHSAWRQRNCATPYLIILSTPKSREGRIRRGATPNSVSLQRLTGQGRVRMSGVVSHVTTMQLEGSQNSVVWKGREAEGEARLALSRRSFQRPPGEDSASAERAAGARPSS